LPGLTITVTGTNISTVTDARGAYVLALNPGSVTLTASIAGYTSFVTPAVVIAPGTPRTSNIRLGRVATITGRVTREDTAGGFPGVLVRIVDTNIQATTTAAGTFNLTNVAAGTVRITATTTDPRYEDFESPNITLIPGQALIYDIVMLLTNDEAEVVVPEVTALQGNFPNPFNPSTQIRFDLARAEHVTIEIFNIRGQRVKTLVNGEMEAGRHNIEWAGTDDRGRTVGSGIYFYSMKAGEYSSTRRMVLMK